MKSYLRDILEKLRGYTAPSSNLLMASILRKIVAFNQPRLQIYIKTLSTQTQICLETPTISTELSDKINELRDLAVKADDQKSDEGKCK